MVIFLLQLSVFRETKPEQILLEENDSNFSTVDDWPPSIGKSRIIFGTIVIAMKSR